MLDPSALFRAITQLAPPATWSAEVAEAVAVAEAAGSRLMERFGRVTGRLKADGSPVTDADLDADAYICERLRAAFPGDAVLSEEGDTRYAGDRRVWVVDPLDGTSNYCHGVPMWGVSLALVADGRPVVAVSHFPCLRLLYWAAAGHGAWEGGRRLDAARDEVLGADDLVTFCSRTPRRFDLHLGGRGRMLGSETLNLALVAAGAVHASLAATSYLWDLAAGWLLVAEAGGVIETLDRSAIWPLQPGDYGQHTFATAAAGNSRLLEVVRAGVLPHVTASPLPWT